MANFKTHLVGGFAASGILGLVTYKAGLVNASEFLICVLIGTAGGLLPDIDSDNSTPIKISFDLMSLAFAFAAVIYWRSSLSLLEMLALWIIGYLIIRYAVFAAFTRLTVHRGIIHSIPYMAILAMALVLINYYLLNTPSTVSWFYGFFLLFGSLIHLGLDEAYSVDLLGQRLKKSSGTAMKLYQDSQRFYYFGLYALLVVCFYAAPPIEPFLRKLNDPITWWLLKESLLPTMFG